MNTPEQQETASSLTAEEYIAPIPAPDPAAPPSPPLVPGTIPPVPGRRRNGKVARLPKKLRDDINQWIEDGVSYLEIIERLGEPGRDITPNNLSEWKNGGHQDWLLQQQFVEDVRARQDVMSDLVHDQDPTCVTQAALHLATLHIFNKLRDIDHPLGGDPNAFARLLNTLARLSREALVMQQYRDACARSRAAISEMKDPHRKLTDEERLAIIHKVDEVLGINLEVPLKPFPAPPPAASSPPGPPDTFNPQTPAW